MRGNSILIPLYSFIGYLSTIILKVVLHPNTTFFELESNETEIELLYLFAIGETTV